MAREVKQAEELQAMGGRFYELAGRAWCDVGPDSYYLEPGEGYVRLDPPDEGVSDGEG